MMVKHKRIAVLTLAGLVSVLLTGFGLMAFAFSETGNQNQIAVTLFWVLPLIALPLFGIYSTWSKMPTTAFWGLLICQWATMSWLNWGNSLRVGMATPNLVLIALSGGVAFPVWCWFVIAALCQYEHHLRGKRDLLPA